MAWIGDSSVSATDMKGRATLNGPMLFNSGPFCIQYGLITVTSTSEWSIVANQLSATADTNPLAATAASTPLSLANDPTGKWPASTLYMPGFGSNSSQLAPMGAFTLGTIIKARFISTFTAGGTFLPKLVLRNPVTGAVAYTLTDTSTYSPTASAVGSVLEFYMAVISATQIYATYVHNYSTATQVGVPATTTVDFSKNYVLDATITMGTSGTWAQQISNFELVG